MLMSDDYPHTIPARAYLTWRENWFFIFLDPRNQFYCIAHMSVQPTLGVGRATCSIFIDGKHEICAEEAASPKDWEHLKVVKLGRLTYEFAEPQSRFRIAFEGDDFSLELELTPQMHLFDYLACQSANPNRMWAAELVSCGGTDFRHQNQLLRQRYHSVQDGVACRDPTAGCGPAYRDHSWGLRNDLETSSHTRAFMIFNERVFHVQKINNQRRPESWVREGYSGTAVGNLALKESEVCYEGHGPDGMPAMVRFEMADTEGGTFTVQADVANRLASIPFYFQKPGALGYLMIENFCECTLIETVKRASRSWKSARFSAHENFRGTFAPLAHSMRTC
jgi:hypothetical protein